MLAIAYVNAQSYVAHPATKSVREGSSRSPPQPHPDVHLLPCNRPIGTLESAPRTSLRADSSHERWDGFWSDRDGRYYTRCTRDNGSEQWYRFGEESARIASRVSARETRVLPMRPRSRALGAERAQSNVQRMLLVSRDGGRPILVGTSRRRSAARLGGGHGGAC